MDFDAWMEGIKGLKGDISSGQQDRFAANNPAMNTGGGYLSSGQGGLESTFMDKIKGFMGGAGGGEGSESEKNGMDDMIAADQPRKRKPYEE